MLERTDAITNEVLEQITFVLAYSTVYISDHSHVLLAAGSGGSFCDNGKRKFGVNINKIENVRMETETTKEYR